MGEREHLIAHGRDPEGIRRHLGADTLGYLSLDGLLKAVGQRNRCLGCLTGHYPIPIDSASAKDALESVLGADVPAMLRLASGR
jgi:glutamine phosphoribosylpyrophosphate amidotransferase